MARFSTLNLFAALVLLVTSCASTSSQRSEQRTPQCVSLCHNRLAACTEKSHGDYGACQADFSSCQTNCEERKAMERFEEGDREDVIAPTDPMETPPPAESEEPSSGDEVPE